MASRTHTNISLVTWLPGIFLVAVFLIGGGSRPDLVSLILLRPLAAFAAVFFVARLTSQEWRRIRTPAALAFSAIAITLAQLIPLPPGVWALLPGHDILREAERLAGIEPAWRPLSLVPWRTLNALWSWLVPIAAATAVAHGDTVTRLRMLPVIIAMGLASGFLGVLQLLGPPDGPLYFYDITNTGGAVGLFANRNHNALLLAGLFPLLAAYACAGVSSVEQHRRRSWIAIAVAAGLLPLILVVGSRAGVVLMATGMAATTFIYRTPDVTRPAKRTSRAYHPIRIGVGIGFTCLAAVTFLLSRATAVERLTGGQDELRIEFWERAWPLAERYFPTGAGFGTFIETYQLDEPRNQLALTIANHAHNDWLEVLVGGGVGGGALLFAAVVAWAIATVRLWQSRAVGGDRAILGRTGASLLLMAGIGSIVDYPARTPSLAALFAVATVWLSVAVVPRKGANLASRS